MKNLMIGALFALTTTSACSGLSTNFDYDTSHEFKALTSYTWIDTEENSIAMKRVRAAIDAELRARGIQETSENPDFRIAAHIGSQERLRVVDWGYTYPTRGYWYGGHDIDVYQYEEGSLVIDIIDPAQNALVWRGSASKAIDPSWTPEDRDVEVRKAVNALLSEFPPAK